MRIKVVYHAQAKTFAARNGAVLLYQTLHNKAGMRIPNISSGFTRIRALEKRAYSPNGHSV